MAGFISFFTFIKIVKKYGGNDDQMVKDEPYTFCTESILPSLRLLYKG